MKTNRRCIENQLAQERAEGRENEQQVGFLPERRTCGVRRPSLPLVMELGV